MAAIQQNRVSTNVRAEEIKSTSTVSGDKAIAESLVKGIIDKLSDNPKLNQLFDRIRGPLTAEKGIAAITIIKELPMLIVVPNEVNKDPTRNAFLITRKRYFDITNHQTTTFLTPTQIAALKSENT
jgi:hypothetical protein